MHLLGTASLDALAGYTGQSRSQTPTHTWNTRPLTVAEVGGVVADDRSAAEVVLGGLSREPVTTFAAVDDPWVLDRRLCAERDEHLGVLATAPPDLRTSLGAARAAAERSSRFVERATGDLERAEANLAGFGPLSGLRRSGRTQRSGAEHALTRAAERLASARVERRASEHKLAELEAAEAKRLRFVADDGWRVERVRAINAELDRHWAAATLAAVRQDDLLAFGIDRLRSARAVAADDLAAYRASLPPDRSAAITEASRTLAAAEQDLRGSRAELVQRRRRLELAAERHWGRRDKAAVATATTGVEHAEVAVTAAEATERDARCRLDAEASSQLRRETALGATEARRTELTHALAEIDAALDDTRAQRVTELSTEAIVPAHVAAVLGEMPSDPGARQVWCGLGYRIESYETAIPTPSATRASGAWWPPSAPVRPSGGCPILNGTTWRATSATGPS